MKDDLVKALILILITLALGGVTGASAQKAPLHHGDGRFRNTVADEHHPGFFAFFRARFSSGEWAHYDRENDPVPTTDAAPIAAGATSENATVTWVGHSTVLIQHRGVNVLTDPIFSNLASPLSFAGPKRITAPALMLDELPPIHVVVISHNHYDHLDSKTIKALGNAPMYYVPLGLKAWFKAKGISAERVVEMDWWDERAIEIAGQTLRITATPSQHFSGRGLSDRDKTLWASWAITWHDFTAWFGGDTGYNDVQFKEIGSRIGAIDLGIIPIGAYAPRWFMKSVHVNPEEALKIHQDIGARSSMGIHWGTFILTQEPINEPPANLASALAAAQLPADAFVAYAIGETRHYPATPRSVVATARPWMGHSGER